MFNIFKTDQPNDFIYFSKIKYNVVVYIINFYTLNQYTPTLFEIGQQFNFSRARAGKIVADLYKLGFITKGRSPQRRIRIGEDQISLINTINFNREYPVKHISN
jgi:DNA-binding MarR family transcriptional regulator